MNKKDREYAEKITSITDDLVDWFKERDIGPETSMVVMGVLISGLMASMSQGRKEAIDVADSFSDVMKKAVRQAAKQIQPD